MANKQNAFILRASIRAGWVLAALALLPIAASAKGYSPAVAGSTVSWTNATIGKAQLSSAGAAVAVTAPISLSVATGLAVPAVATAMITGASVGGAWGAAIYGIGAVAIAAIPVIKARMDAAGVQAQPDGKVQTLQGGSTYWTSVAPGPYGSWAAACSATASATGKAYGASGPNSAYCYTYWSSGEAADAFYMYIGSSTPAYAPATVEEAVQKMSAASPTPAEVQALVDANFPPVVQPQSITGPASVAGPNTVKLGLDGSSQTETCKYFLEYFPSNIKAHPECTTVTTIPEKTESKTVTTTNPDGTTSTSVISTKTPATSKTETTTKDAVENKDKSECEQYPNRVGCAELDVPTGEIPKVTKNVSYREETLFGSGSCPADLSASIGTLHQTVKIWDWQKTCEMALPLRALVLSLATFAALLIIMPGGAKS